MHGPIWRDRPWFSWDRMNGGSTTLKANTNVNADSQVTVQLLHLAYLSDCKGLKFQRDSPCQAIGEIEDCCIDITTKDQRLFGSCRVSELIALEGANYTPNIWPFVSEMDAEQPKKQRTPLTAHVICGNLTRKNRFEVLHDTGAFVGY